MFYDFRPILGCMKEAKANAGLTNDELAQKSGVPVGTVNKIMAGGTKEPKLPAFIAIAHALGVSVDYLIYGPAAADGVVSSDDLLIIKKYRALDERGKAAVDATIDREYMESTRLKAAADDAAGVAQRVADTLSGKIPAGAKK